MQDLEVYNCDVVLSSVLNSIFGRSVRNPDVSSTFRQQQIFLWATENSESWSTLPVVV